MTEPMSSKPSSLPPAELAALSAGGAPTAAPAAKMPAPKAENTLGSLIDTVEAIIIALILALTFRAFVLEAFVIPTGSMAPTLLGAHFKATCPECGYHFDVDANLGFQYVYDKNGARWGVAGVKRPDLVRNDNIPCDERATLCPNCGFNIDPTSLPQYIDTRPTAFDARNRSGNASFAWTNNGDRILVFKYLYSVFDPQRWDVIVFKEPREAQNNYIKRLIGRPGETIEIINGDIYVAPPDPTGGKTGPEYRTIARKPLFIQDKLWQLVYDNDYYPIDEGIPRSTGDSWHNPWKGAGPHANEWDIRGPVIQYPAATAGLLQFSVEDPYAFNILGYNRDVNDLPATDLLRVGDLRLECTWTPAEAAGQSLAMVLGAPRNQYKLTWSSAGIELVKYNISTRLWESIRSIPATDTPLPKAGTGYHVVLCNVDHSVQFLVNGKLLLVHAPPWTAADALRERAEIEKEEPNRDRALFLSKPEIRIQVGGACTIGHLKLGRDLYYTQSVARPRPESKSRFPSGPGTATMGNPLTLGPDEFFALGDNSRRSDDGRSWADIYPPLDDLGIRQGIVPKRYLLGKAFFVYWPAGYRPAPSVELPLVPNAGEMRFIR